MSEWWVGRRGADPVGPVSTDTLVRGVKEKKVPPNALVCRVGGQQWQHIAQVEELWKLVNPDEACAPVAEKSSNGHVTATTTAIEGLGDADADDAATRIIDGPMRPMQVAAPSSGATGTQHAESAAESTTVPLVTASTLGTASKSSTTADTETVQAPRPLQQKAAPTRAAAPAFKAPATLARKAESQRPSAQASTGAAGGLKDTVQLPKAVIPAPRFGVDRSAPASPIAAGAFISKPPSVRPEPMTKAAVAPSPASVRQNALPPRVALKPQAADKSRQPIPPVPAAVIPLPPDTELAAMLRDNENVSLTETRPDRRVPKDTGSTQRNPLNRQATTVAGHVVAKDKQGAGAAQKASDRPPAPRPAASKATSERQPPLEARPIVQVTDAEDDEATVVRGFQAPASIPPEEDWTIVRGSPAPASIPPDEDATVILKAQPAPASIPPDFEDATVVLDVQPAPASIPPDEEATVIQEVRPLPAVSVDAHHQGNPPAHGELDKLAVRPATARLTDSGAESRATSAAQAKPAARVTAPKEAPPVSAGPRLTSDVEPRELFDEDDEFLPARAKDYASAHGPPSPVDNGQPRPAAGTPAPPSVIVAQRQVTMNGAAHLPLVHTELTHPALRSLHPPGTVQISIATLIVGAMALVVLVLAAVLLLR